MPLRSAAHRSPPRETWWLFPGVPPEGQKFQPHVTLARSKGELVPKLGEFLVHHNLFRSPPFEVTHFTLYSSYLNHNGAIYMPERSYELSRELKRA